MRCVNTGTIFGLIIVARRHTSPAVWNSNFNGLLAFCAGLRAQKLMAQNWPINLGFHKAQDWELDLSSGLCLVDMPVEFYKVVGFSSVDRASSELDPQMRSRMLCYELKSDVPKTGWGSSLLPLMTRVESE